MAAREILAPGINGEGSLVGFSITLAGLAFEVFSAHCSSPWSNEAFGGPPERAASARRYAWKAIAVTEVLGLGGVLLTRNLMPLATCSLVSAYMWWTYDVALTKAAESNSVDWNSKASAWRPTW
jgi:hypothetical protein